MANGIPGSGSPLAAALTTALVTFVVAVVTIPTDFVVGRWKFAINRADMRGEQYAAIAKQISTYVFEAQIYREFFERGVTHFDTLKAEVESYNKAISELRKDEYANRAIIRKFWSTSTATRFDELMREVKAVDKVAHEMNGPLNDYLNDTRNPRVLDTGRTTQTAKTMKPHVDKLCQTADVFLLSLSGDDESRARQSCDSDSTVASTPEGGT